MRMLLGISIYLFFIIAVHGWEFQSVGQINLTKREPVLNMNRLQDGDNSSFAVWGDFDLDGDLDIYVINDGSPNALYRNNFCSRANPCLNNLLEKGGSPEFMASLPSPLFTEASLPENKNFFFLKDGISSSKSAYWVDIDSDGDLDLYLVNDGVNRLFINNLFSPENPYNPLLSLEKQLTQEHWQNAGFTYKESSEFLLRRQASQASYQAALSQDDKLAVLLAGNALSTLSGDTFIAGTGTNFVRSGITPGMYLQMSAAGTRYRFPILDVVTEKELRIQRPYRYDTTPSLGAVSSFYIVEDIANTLESLDIIPGCALESSSGNRSYYRCPNVSLRNDFRLEMGDRLIFEKENQNMMVEVNFISGDTFGVSPPPSLDGFNIVENNFKLTIRRINGEIVRQVYLRDSNESVRISTDVISQGDLLEIVLAENALNRRRQLEIQDVGTEGSVFIVPLSDADAVAEEVNLVYDFTYSSGSTTTKRFLENPQAKFTADPTVAHHRAKIGDHIIIDPNISGTLLNDQGASGLILPANIRAALSQGYLYSDGNREGGVLEILEIVSENKLLVDAYPSEVGLPQNAQNSNFTYQLRHRFGSLRREPNPLPGEENWYTRFAENAPLVGTQLSNRDFLLQMGINTDHVLGEKFGSQMILRGASVIGQNIVIDFNAYVVGTVAGNVQNHTLRLTTREQAPANSGNLNNIEYRPVFHGLTTNPYKEEGKTLRIPADMNTDAYEVAPGYYIYLRRLLVGAVNTPLSRRIEINDVQKQENYTEITLREAPPIELRAHFEWLCGTSPECDPSDETLTDDFFKTFPDSLAEVDYEFIVGPPPGGGFTVSCEVTIDTDISGGFPALGLQANDAVEFSPPLTSDTGFVYGALIDELVEISNIPSRALLEIDLALNAPFNENLSNVGFKPVFRGALFENRRVFRTFPIDDQEGFSRIASPGDWLLFFRRDPLQGFAPNSVTNTAYTTRIQIRAVENNFVDLSMFLYDALGISEEESATTSSPNFINPNQFFFRILRSTGRLFQRPAFVDRRPGLDFGEQLLLDDDKNIRGTVLLDLYRPAIGNENSLNTSLEKRFRPRSLIYKNMLELESISASDMRSAYFYEIQQHEREKSVLVPFPENDKGFGQRAEFADWTYDGRPEIYILNRASGSTDKSWDNSVLHIGSAEPETDTVGNKFKNWETDPNVSSPAISPSGVERLLKNMPYNEIDSFKRLGIAVRALDFNGDRLSDLLIWNTSKQTDNTLNAYLREAAGRLFFSSNSGLKADELGILDYEADPLINLTPQDNSLLGLNSAAVMNQASSFADLIVGQMNNDNYTDVFILTRPEIATTDDPYNFNLFMGGIGQDKSFKRVTPNNSNYASLLTNQKFYSRMGGEMVDFNSDGFMDISLLTKSSHYLFEPFLRGENSVSNPQAREFSCGGITDANSRPFDLWPNQHIVWGDFNFDGYPDYYVSRKGSPAERNIICLSIPPTDPKTSNFFALKLIPRDLILRRDTNRPVFMGRITLTETTAPSRKFVRNFNFSYPLPQRISIGTGSVSSASIKIEWPDKSVFEHGIFTASSQTKKEIELIQPADFQVLPANSGRFATPTTWVGPTTTNVEALSFNIMPSAREDLVLTRLSAILRQSGGGSNDLIKTEGTPGKIPTGSVKLYLDSSSQTEKSTDLSKLKPNGLYDTESDIFLATGDFKLIEVPDEYYYVDDTNKRILTPFYLAEFAINGFTIPGFSSINSIEIPRSVPGETPVSLPLLMVFTFDNVTDSKILRFNLSKRIAFGLEEFFRASVEDIEQNFDLTSPYNLSYDIGVYGKNTKLPHRAVSVADNITPLPALTELKGCEIKVDNVPPSTPSVDKNSYQTNAFNITISGRIIRRTIDREGDITIQAQNITKNDEPIFVKVPYGESNWSLILSDLFEGENDIEITALDEFANSSDTVSVKIWVDSIPPDIYAPLVSNINIAKATILWNTTEAAIGGTKLRSTYGEQSFIESQPHLLRLEHNIEVGRSRQFYYNKETLDKCSGSDMAVYYDKYNPQIHTSKYSNSALCPDTVYTVDIYARDALNNFKEIIGSLEFKTLPLTQQTVGEEEYLDADGDGIPDYIEWSEDYPDLDPFDANDALLDFDNDGISNIEEYLAGTDMYDPFDSLPIPNAGIDQILYPGIVQLSADASNFNNLLEREIVYRWKIESIPGAAIATQFPRIFNDTEKKAFFAARKAGEYIVTLSLSNQRGASPKEDSLKVTIRNVPPIASAGNDGFGQVHKEIALDGRHSKDANGDELIYRWVQIRGPGLSAFPEGSDYGMFKTTSALAYFKTDKVGEYAFELFVTEKESERKNAKAKVTIQVNSENDIFPTAHAGDDFMAVTNTWITLDGGFSKGRSAQTELSYTWNLITPNLYGAAERCANIAITGQEAQLEWENSRSRFQRFPRLKLKEPGIYAFNLQIEETETGLKALPSCVKILVEKPASSSPIANPKNDGAPQPIKKLISSSMSRISFSRGQADLPDYNTIRTPVNYEVQLSGNDSFMESGDKNVCHNDSGFWSEGLCPLPTDCLKLEKTPFPYEWSQVSGEAVILKPVYYDCSIVRFAPIMPGIYSFDLTLNTKDAQGYSKKSLPQRINVVANDYNTETPQLLYTNPETSEQTIVTNRFIPYIKAGKNTVVQEGTVLLPTPKCLDEDFGASSVKIDDDNFFEYVYPENELKSCSEFTELSCIWQQKSGPSALLSSPTSCTPWFNAMPGSYTFTVQAFDGYYYSLPDELTIVAVPKGASAPVAISNPPRSAIEGERVYLSGSSSVATQKDFRYVWTQKQGLSVMLLDDRSKNPNFLARKRGTYSFSLQIEDDKGIFSLPTDFEVMVQRAESRIPDPVEEAVKEQQNFEIEGGGGGGGGCFIVTAATGSKNSWLVQYFQTFRNLVLNHFALGRQLMEFYYRNSPPIAEYIAASPILKSLSLLLLILTAILLNPLFWLLALLWCCRARFYKL